MVRLIAYWDQKVYRQEDQPAAEGAEGEQPGEDRCHPSACNKRLRATQSPNNHHLEILQELI